MHTLETNKQAELLDDVVETSVGDRNQGHFPSLGKARHQEQLRNCRSPLHVHFLSKLHLILLQPPGCHSHQGVACPRRNIVSWPLHRIA